MADEHDGDLEKLRSDQAPTFDADLGARPSVAGLDALLVTIESLRLEPVPWAERADVVATIESDPRPLRTRDHAVIEELIDVVRLPDVPDWMDPQVNIRAHGDVAEVELEIDEPVGALWSVIDVLGEPVGAVLVADPSDPRLRIARLPLALVSGHVVRVLLRPEE